MPQSGAGDSSNVIWLTQGQIKITCFLLPASPVPGRPQPGQDCGTTWAGQDWGTPPGQDRTGIPPLPQRLNTRESTWYAAGTMPLAFTQEDFLVLWFFFSLKLLL